MAEPVVCVVVDAVVPLLLRNLLLVAQVVMFGVMAVQVLAPAAVVSGVGVAVGRAMERRQRGSLERAMLGAGLCAGCGYPLGGLEAGVDGRTGCPECGGAWVVPVGGESGGEGEGGETEIRG